MPTATVTTAVTASVGDGNRLKTAVAVTIAALSKKFYSSVLTAVTVRNQFIGDSGYMAGRRYRR